LAAGSVNVGTWDVREYLQHPAINVSIVELGSCHRARTTRAWWCVHFPAASAVDQLVVASTPAAFHRDIRFTGSGIVLTGTGTGTGVGGRNWDQQYDRVILRLPVCLGFFEPLSVNGRWARKGIFERPCLSRNKFVIYRCCRCFRCCPELPSCQH
jgi:hypothetical protein